MLPPVAQTRDPGSASDQRLYGNIGIGHTAEPALSAAHPEWIFAGISSDCVVASSKYPHLRDQTGNSQPRASRACRDGPGVVTLPLSSWTDTSPRPT